MTTQIMHIALCANDNYAPWLGVTIYSILKNNPNHQFFFHILDSDINPENKKKIRSLIKETSHQLEFITVDAGLFKDYPVQPDSHLSVEAYYRFILPHLFSNLDRLLYLDVDILVLGDLAPLYNMDLGDHLLAMVPDITSSECCERLNIKDRPYFNSGVTLFNINKIDEKELTTSLFRFAKETNVKLIYYDQDVYNLVVGEKIYILPEQFNMQTLPFLAERVQEQKAHLDQITVLHFISGLKPWKKEPHPFKEFYNSYLENTPWRTPIMKHIAKKVGRFIYRRKKTSTSKIWRICGIPILKRVKKGKYERRIYLLGVPVYRQKTNKWQIKYDNLIEEGYLSKADTDAIKRQLDLLDSVNILKGKK